MPIIVSNNKVVSKNDKVISTIDMSWQSKINNWLTGDIAYLTKSGTKVLTWTDKVNGNIWTDYNASYNVTHTDGDNYLYFNSGGLTFPNSITNTKEVFMVFLKTQNLVANQQLIGKVGTSRQILRVFFVNISASFAGVVNPIYYKNSFSLNSKRVWNGSWTSGTGSMIIGLASDFTFPFCGRFYEFLTFSSTLTDSQREGLNYYMKTLHPDIAN